MSSKLDNRVQVSPHFYLDEFMHPYLYKKFGAKSIRYLPPALVQMAELIRKSFNNEMQLHNENWKEKGMYYNTWGTGGNLKNCGVRCYLQPHKKGSLSRHYLGLCGDLHLNGGGDEKPVYDHILNNEDFYFNRGLTTLEDFNYTPNWVHFSLEWQLNANKITIIKP